MASVPLLIERWGSYPVFDALRPKGHPGIMSLENPGRYVMLALVNGNPITTLPFTFNVESSGDPFNPKKTFTRDGPWQSLAFFSVPLEKPDTPLKFNWWSCRRENPRRDETAKVNRSPDGR